MLQAALIAASLTAGHAVQNADVAYTGPIRRDEPKIYRMTFAATVSTPMERRAENRLNFNLQDTPIVFPLIEQGAYSEIDASSLAGHLWLGNVEDTTLPQRSRIDRGAPMGTQLAIMPIAQFQGQSLRWEIAFDVQCWASEADDAALGQIAWPREWPAEVSDALKPQMYIESDDEIFKATVERVSEGKLRMVPPYYAAKDLIRYCLNEIRVSGDGINKGYNGELQGLEMIGAKQTATSGTGGPHDLVCVCVAMLRAAGIPARPVIGISEGGRKGRRGRAEFLSWGEFYLPGAGWIPFDPDAMRGKGLRNADVKRPWSQLGTIRDLNERIPLAYHFIPPVSVSVPRNPAVWGWDMRPVKLQYVDQFINLGIVSKGAGAIRVPQAPGGTR
ncbi:MAG: transglutaminase domain-containing protein [Phycisphaerales bacterium]|nr:transglutaminase domain-containing protein [Phycisphaerales bacterium]